MIKSPIISICIPTYNGEEYLAEAIESALNQTFQDFELVIVDDCSSDKTIQIANQYAINDSRIKIFSNSKNLGLVENWNNCITLSKGEWIKFLFQDDYLEKNCLEKMLNASGCHLFVIANRSYIFENGISKKDIEDYTRLENVLNFSSIYKKKDSLSNKQFSYAIAMYPSINIMGEPTSMLIKKDAFAKYGFFDEQFKQTCDYEYWARIGTNCGAALVHQKLVNFRVHNKSTTMNNHADKTFQVSYMDYFYFATKILKAPEFARFRTSIKTSTTIIELKIAEHARSLKKWQSGNTDYTTTARKTFPDFAKYFENPNLELIIRQLMCIYYFPSYFGSLISNKIIGKLSKIKKFTTN